MVVSMLLWSLVVSVVTVCCSMLLQTATCSQNNGKVRFSFPIVFRFASQLRFVCFAKSNTTEHCILVISRVKHLLDRNNPEKKNTMWKYKVCWKKISEQWMILLRFWVEVGRMPLLNLWTAKLHVHSSWIIFRSLCVKKVKARTT